MHNPQQTAYDLSLFEERQRTTERAPLRVAKADTKARRRQIFLRVQSIAAAAVCVALVVGVLQSRARVTELAGQIEDAQNILSEEQSEYDYLSVTLESQTNLTSVEQIARTQLGMTKLEKENVRYISLETEDAVYKPEGEISSFLSGLEMGFLDLMEYIAP
ncbi:MAG: cell division protein FtsL [Pygmaiobacter massiliensis]|nr:cell division protein FtsL [Pygmaiobacter massiliensis]